jgi:hypothetical protein
MRHTKQNFKNPFWLLLSCIMLFFLLACNAKVKKNKSYYRLSQPTYKKSSNRYQKRHQQSINYQQPNSRFYKNPYSNYPYSDNDHYHVPLKFYYNDDSQSDQKEELQNSAGVSYDSKL